jgi:hypothetical protein
MTNPFGNGGRWQTLREEIVEHFSNHPAIRVTDDRIIAFANAHASVTTGSHATIAARIRFIRAQLSDVRSRITERRATRANPLPPIFQLDPTGQFRVENFEQIVTRIRDGFEIMSDVTETLPNSSPRRTFIFGHPAPILHAQDFHFDEALHRYLALILEGRARDQPVRTFTELSILNF